MLNGTKLRNILELVKLPQQEAKDYNHFEVINRIYKRAELTRKQQRNKMRKDHQDEIRSDKELPITQKE